MLNQLFLKCSELHAAGSILVKTVQIPVTDLRGRILQWTVGDYCVSFYSGVLIENLG